MNKQLLMVIIIMNVISLIGSILLYIAERS